MLWVPLFLLSRPPIQPPVSNSVSVSISVRTTLTSKWFCSKTRFGRLDGSSEPPADGDRTLTQTRPHKHIHVFTPPPPSPSLAQQQLIYGENMFLSFVLFMLPFHIRSQCVSVCTCAAALAVFACFTSRLNVYCTTQWIQRSCKARAEQRRSGTRLFVGVFRACKQVSDSHLFFMLVLC